MNRYVLLKNGPCRVPLLSTKNGFTVSMGRKKYAFTESVERMWIYWLYQTESKSSLAAHLRCYISQDITPVQIDSVIRQFKEARVPEPVECYSLQDVPMFANPEDGLQLPIPSTYCTISAENEKELMQMILDEPYDTVMKRLRSWFIRFCCDFGIDYSEYCENQYMEMAKSFLHQHGIDTLPKNPVEVTPARSRRKKGEGLKVLMMIIGAAAVYFGIMMLCLEQGNKLMDGEHPLLGALLAVIFFTMLGWPINKILGR